MQYHEAKHGSKCIFSHNMLCYFDICILVTCNCLDLLVLGTWVIDRSLAEGWGT
jgi:hypothetical protein